MTFGTKEILIYILFQIISRTFLIIPIYNISIPFHHSSSISFVSKISRCLILEFSIYPYLLLMCCYKVKSTRRRKRKSFCIIIISFQNLIFLLDLYIYEVQTCEIHKKFVLQKKYITNVFCIIHSFFFTSHQKLYELPAIYKVSENVYIFVQN